MSYLRHHGILGQRWGKRNGPPYPLEPSMHSQSEKQAGYRRSLNKSTGGIQNESSKRGLSDGQKTAIKVGAALAVTALAAYGGYQLYKTGALDGLISKGKELAGKGTVSETFEHGFRKMSQPDSVSQAMKVVNPYPKSEGGQYNCTSCSFAGFLRTRLGLDVIAKPMKDPMANSYDTMSKIVKDFDKQTLHGTGVKFCKSLSDSQEMILKKFKEDGAEGVVVIPSSISNGSHMFNWKIIKGQVEYFDYQQKHDMSNFDFRRYFWVASESKEFYCTRLDNAELNWDEVKKLVLGR